LVGPGGGPPWASTGSSASSSGSSSGTKAGEFRASNQHNSTVNTPSGKLRCVDHGGWRWEHS
jgi:hypothetical protein